MPRFRGESGGPLAVATHLRHEIIDQHRLQGHVGDDLLDRLALHGHRVDQDGPRRLRAALVGERLAELRNPALAPADPSERQQHRLDLLRFRAPALRQDDHVGRRGLAAAEPVAHLEERADRHRNSGERLPKRNLTDLDPTSDFDFLLSGEERNLADLPGVTSERVLALRG